MSETGWQSDGSYVPCPECLYVPPPDRPGPGVPVRIPGTIHEASCPTIPRLSPEAQRKLTEDLDAMDRARRRAYVEARNVFIG